MNKPGLKTVLVTGACGFVGKFLVDELIISHEYRVIALCRDARKTAVKEQLTYVEADLNDDTKISEMYDKFKPEIVLHLAAMARLKDGEQHPDKAYRTNYMATKKLVKLSVKHRVQKFIFVSSDMAREHTSVVGITKYLAEAFIQNLPGSGTSFVTVRLPNISWTPGSVQTIFKRLIEAEKPITITDPGMSRRFISGTEAAQQILYALKEGRDKDIFVDIREPDKITDLAKTMIIEAGKKLEIEFIGMKPGEKLSEKSYAKNEIEHTSFKYFALLKNQDFSPKEIKKTQAVLQQRPGFSTKVNND